MIYSKFMKKYRKELQRNQSFSTDEISFSKKINSYLERLISRLFFVCYKEKRIVYFCKERKRKHSRPKVKPFKDHFAKPKTCLQRYKEVYWAHGLSSSSNSPFLGKGKISSKRTVQEILGTIFVPLAPRFNP